MLRDYAELDKKLVLVGQGNKIEVWSELHWQDGMRDWVKQGAQALNEDSNDFSGLSV